MSFGEHLRALREEAGLSRAELARQAGVPVSTLRNWEGDRGMPGLPALVRLAAALGVPVERFAEGVEDPAELDPAPGPTPTKRGRAGRLPEQGQGRGLGRPWVDGCELEAGREKIRGGLGRITSRGGDVPRAAPSAA
jgi:transcriptional regulator with XRE-family HTH domain